MLPFREAVERDFACVDLRRPGAEICSVHRCVVLCTNFQLYVLFTVLPSSHQVGNCWTLFFRFPLTSGIIDWLRVKEIVAYHTVLTLFLLKGGSELDTNHVAWSTVPSCLESFHRGRFHCLSVPMQYCSSILKTVSSSIYSASLWSLSFKSHQHPWTSSCSKPLVVLKKWFSRLIQNLFLV